MSKNIHVQAMLNVCFIDSSTPVCVTLGYVNVFSYVLKDSNEEFSFLNISGALSHAKWPTVFSGAESWTLRKNIF